MTLPVRHEVRDRLVRCRAIEALARQHQEAIWAVFAGRGQKVEAATADGVLRFQATDEQTRELLHDVAESASAADTVYTL